MKINNHLHNYDIYPKVFPENKEIEICIKPLGKHVEFSKDADYRIVVCPFFTGVPHNYPELENFVEIKPALGDDGILRFTHAFKDEQEHYIRLYDDNEDDPEKIFQLSVYSLKEDLVGRYPFKGDLHMHTCRSDGKQSPAIVSSYYRKYGYDFFAITDHRRYYPALEAMDAFKDVPIEFRILPGEEVHLPRVGCYNNDVHIVNFGGKYSVNALISDSAHNLEVGTSESLRSYEGKECPEIITPEQYKDEVLALAETLDIPDGVPKFSYASCVWIFNHIKNAEGLGIFAHPYWISNVIQVPEVLTDYLLETKPFDAFEVLGGELNYEQNGFQTQKYYEDRAKGRNYPIVGSTDSHSCFNNDKALCASTIIFSPENEREALIDSVKKFYSVAIDSISTEFRIVGDFRLSKYACFLMQNYFPLHDDLCYEEGRLMKDYACGDADAGETLKFISGRMAKQRRKYFAF